MVSKDISSLWSWVLQGWALLGVFRLDKRGNFSAGILRESISARQVWEEGEFILEKVRFGVSRTQFRFLLSSKYPPPLMTINHGALFCRGRSEREIELPFAQDKEQVAPALILCQTTLVHGKMSLPFR